jgi:hypothetical protein
MAIDDEVAWLSPSRWQLVLTFRQRRIQATPHWGR